MAWEHFSNDLTLLNGLSAAFICNGLGQLNFSSPDNVDVRLALSYVENDFFALAYFFSHQLVSSVADIGFVVIIKNIWHYFDQVLGNVFSVSIHIFPVDYLKHVISQRQQNTVGFADCCIFHRADMALFQHILFVLLVFYSKELPTVHSLSRGKLAVMIDRPLNSVGQN